MALIIGGIAVAGLSIYSGVSNGIHKSVPKVERDNFPHRKDTTSGKLFGYLINHTPLPGVTYTDDSCSTEYCVTRVNAEVVDGDLVHILSAFKVPSSPRLSIMTASMGHEKAGQEFYIDWNLDDRVDYSRVCMDGSESNCRETTYRVEGTSDRNPISNKVFLKRASNFLILYENK